MTENFEENQEALEVAEVAEPVEAEVDVETEAQDVEAEDALDPGEKAVQDSLSLCAVWKVSGMFCILTWLRKARKDERRISRSVIWSGKPNFPNRSSYGRGGTAY